MEKSLNPLTQHMAVVARKKQTEYHNAHTEREGTETQMVHWEGGIKSLG